MKLKNGQKVLDIHINEYDSLDELKKDFSSIPPEMIENGAKLYSSKKIAFNKINESKNISRYFYYKLSKHQGKEYYQLHEILID